MTPLTVEAIRINPDLLGAIEARARRARAEAVHALITRFFTSLKAQLDARPRDVRWG